MSSYVLSVSRRLNTTSCSLRWQGKFTIIKDCAKIADNTFVPPNTVIPALSLFGGSPGHFVEDLPESTQEMVEAMTKQHYTRFQPDPNEPAPPVRR